MDKAKELYDYSCSELVALRKGLDRIMKGVDPAPTPDPDPILPDNRVPTLGSMYNGTHNFKPMEVMLFKCYAEVRRNFFGQVNSLQVTNTSVTGQKRTVHLLVKEDHKPTLQDFQKTWGRAVGLSGSDGLWHRYNIGSAAEMVEVDKVMKGKRYFYIMLYNYGKVSVKYQRLTLSKF